MPNFQHGHCVFCSILVRGHRGDGSAVFCEDRLGKHGPQQHQTGRCGKDPDGIIPGEDRQGHRAGGNPQGTEKMGNDKAHRSARQSQERKGEPGDDGGAPAGGTDGQEHSCPFSDTREIR